MTQCNECRLCRNIAQDSVRLYDGNGHFSEVYDITIKFFHPMFLHMECGISKLLASLCKDCWSHISGFYNFQQTVLLLQAKLLKDAATIAQKQDAIPRCQRDSLVAPNNDLGINLKAQYNSISEMQTINTQREGQLFVADLVAEVKIETNLEEKECTHEINSSNVASVEMEEEFEDPVGVFVGGKFSNDDALSDISFSELEAIDVQFSSDEESDHNMHENNTMKLRKSPAITTENSTSANDDCRKKKKPSKELDAVISQWKPTLECDICHDTCTTFTLLQQHFRKTHPKTEFRISCCNRKFKIRRCFEEHARLHMDPNAFQCSHCQKCCTSKSNLEKHLLHMHSNVTEKIVEGKKQNFRHKCPMCDKAYKVPSALREHLCTHTGEFTRRCLFCDKTYKYRSSLTYHINTVHPEKIVKNGKNSSNRYKELAKSITC